MDEPLSALDPRSARIIKDFLNQLKTQGITTIMSTHVLEIAQAVCDRIAIIDHGKIVALDTSANLKKQLNGADTAVIKLEIANLNAKLVETIRALKCADSVSQEDATHLKVLVHGNEAFDSIIDAIRAKNGKINSMENLHPSLEDVFLHLTGHQVRDAADQKIPTERRHGPFARPRARIR